MDRRLGRRANRRMRECRGGLEGIMARVLSLREESVLIWQHAIAGCHCLISEKMDISGFYLGFL